MADHCKITGDMLARLQHEGVLDSDTQDELERHLADCEVCRAFVYEQRFSSLLKAVYSDDSAGPSPGFYAALNLKLDGAERGRGAGLFADMIGQLGLKLVPALAALVIVLSGTTAFLSREEPAATGSYAAVDIILFESDPVSPDLVIAAVMGDDL